MILPNPPVAERIPLNAKGEPIDPTTQQPDLIKPEKIFALEASETDNSTKLSSDSPENEDIVTYPEGGWTAWGVVLGSWLALFGSMSFMNSLGAFQAYLLRNQ